MELHNAIVRESSQAPGHPPLPTVNYFEYWAATQGDDLNQLSHNLRRPLLDFLSKCDVILEERQNLTPFVIGLASPSEVYPGGQPIFEYNDCAKIYQSNDIENDSIGLVFDMTSNKASWIDFMYDTPPGYTEHVWVPLDQVLETWLNYIRRGRCTPRGNEEWAPTGGSMQGWDMVYPPMRDVEETLTTWNQYVSLVESKLPSPGTPRRLAEPRPAFKGFAEAFFSRARIPTFRNVAPSLIFPSASQMSVLAARQQERFQAEEESFISERDGFMKVIPTVLFPLGDNIHAGLSTTKERGWQDAVGLILPMSEGYDAWSGPIDDSNDLPRYERVWQVVPLESPYWPRHPARLTWVLRKWIELVEDGTWKVGPDGIEGGWDDFTHWEECIGLDYMPSMRLSGMLLDTVDAC